MTRRLIAVTTALLLALTACSSDSKDDDAPEKPLNNKEACQGYADALQGMMDVLEAAPAEGSPEMQQWREATVKLSQAIVKGQNRAESTDLRAAFKKLAEESTAFEKAGGTGDMKGMTDAMSEVGTLCKDAGVNVPTIPAS